MHFLLKYLDTRKAAINALQDFQTMESIIETTPTEVKQLRGNLECLSSPRLDGMPKGNDPKAGETRLAARLDQIDLRWERYREAKEYMDWFLPAWGVLTDDDRWILETFFLTTGSKEDAVMTVADKFYIERSSAHDKKNRALRKFATALYGT